MIFKGSAVALVTPFTKDSKVDFDKLGELVEYQIANGTDAIVACGTTGEANTMTDEEQLATIKYVVEKVNKRVPVIAGSGSNDTMHSVNLSQEAEKLGVDALLIITPYYNKANKAGLKRHFETIANSVKLPIILYNVPGRTCVNISPSLIVELAKIDNIVAVKEASGDLGQVAEIASLVPDDFAIYSGNDDTILPLLSLGGQGVISVLANVCPQETHDLVAKFFEGDIEGSRKLQLGMDALIAALFIEVNPIPVKTAMNLLGFNVGDLRLPLAEMDPVNLEVLKKELVNFGLKVNA
ncbi:MULTISPECIES: 4-hydroxy-tetrahydrodipicolinate synthase [unclassified Clostridioides]|uniref:4-hydroxy-tetrahydrodipicolinate synthase n=1 Tax=unclassified Clostridioides TaxID=2635829 RepID=UPI001D109903|nr:4-hydroxy-tetrahydrodipicolinate synthase [Clostridioides sp. ZZV14-6150]MCC0660538.1 4-hydroxy-tetrahydrodipicolinate synthase [Clostridioides sp. ZZV14-6154]MCC0669583.1 4-hydroxy-tetrahydrodipicolinate synthase [Clostridioides sp. ZZV14-6153]MCC0723398.1 4-hydroxy-tetrahydrodipicolinate synthase [Clostridioides sp. ZZV14-6104]MCC0726638.1 4-hydroxy-tetrahydrodipicolinate synthase [Clostridioides sp. ZZV14-6045]MCC0730534.1 4-hydroxy-tetrahydrodipicolinate synthase [Clostridioides sp. ZZV